MITVYPTFEPTYHTYYLRGVVEVAGSHQLRYGTDGFPELHRLCFAFIVDGLKLYIDARDPTDYDAKALEWCDVYGKINIDWAALPAAAHDRFLPIGPNFSIRQWAPPAAALNALRNYLVGRGRIARKDTRRFFAGYWQQYKAHQRYEAYVPRPSEEDYVYFSSTLWPDEPTCNQFRANFVIACKSLPWLRFEGGLFLRRAGVEVRPEWEPAMDNAFHPSIDAYLPHVQRSMAVFNTPAVLGCHGWKLGEYLALGKAIISTPPLRALPAPLVHGEHAHIVDGSVESLREAITLLDRDRVYRQRLERGARAYFDQYLTPRRAIERLIEAARAAPRGAARAVGERL